MNLTALSDLTFSLGHILIEVDSIFSANIAIVHGDREGHRMDNRDGVRRCASNRLTRRLLRR